jgi:hypothetical protein
MRRSISILVFLIFLNSTATLLGAAGVTDALGVEPAIQDDGALDRAEQSAERIEPAQDQSSLGSFVGITTGVINQLEAVITAPVAAPLMLTSLGVPSIITGFVFAPMYLLVTVDLIYYITGRGD